MLRTVMTALILVFVMATVAGCDSQSANRGGVASNPDTSRESSRNSD